ncbi:CFA/I fimbrial subunit D [compost metagenome]
MYRLRMDKAAFLLVQSNDKIYEVAQNLGYMKTSYFIKLFKEKYGLTPQEYRDQLLNRG